jgi:RimJ/RimL family protein N-acetyltransferase
MNERNLSSRFLRQNGDYAISELKVEMEKEISLLLEWENDISIRHLQFVNRSEEEFKKHRITRENILKRLNRFNDSGKGFLWVVFYLERPVGLLTAQIDPEPLLRKIPGTFWPSIVIGDPAARGKGVAKQAMKWCEEFALENGCGRIEIGVFEFNMVAFNLYKSLGYREFARTEDFTWWNGKMYADIRMEKEI